jgi:hypothetical protein
VRSVSQYYRIDSVTFSSSFPQDMGRVITESRLLIVTPSSGLNKCFWIS